MPFLTHNMARPPTDFCAACFRGHTLYKTRCAKLSGRLIFLSIEAREKVMTPQSATYLGGRLTAAHTRAKRVKKGHAILCDSAVCALVLCLLSLRRDLRQIIWQKSAMNHVKPHKAT